MRAFKRGNRIFIVLQLEKAKDVASDLIYAGEFDVARIIKELIENE